MATYKDELEKIEAQEKQLNAQKNQISSAKTKFKKRNWQNRKLKTKPKQLNQLNSGLLIIVQSLILNVLLTNEIAMMCMSR